MLKVKKLFLIKFLIISFTVMPSISFAKALSDAHICVAAMATVMNQEAETIKIDRQQKQITHISFLDIKDNIKWEFKCLMEGNRVQWATKMGNWRNTRLDSVIEFEIQDEILMIQESHKNGSVFKKQFNIKELASKHDIDSK